jgi:putative transposase
MKKSKFTEAQVVFALKQAETGVTVEEVCRKMGISEATFYNWKKKYRGLGVSELRRLRQLEEVSRSCKFHEHSSKDSRRLHCRVSQKKGLIRREQHDYYLNFTA